MAKRDIEFRERVLELDDYYCVVCGFDGHDEAQMDFLHADHVVPRGMGGVPSRDDLANGMALCAKCHQKKTNEIIVVGYWDRNDLENGLIVRRNTGEVVPKDELWFYKKQDKEILERSIEACGIIAMSSAQKAEIMANIWRFYGLSDAVSPKQLVSRLGLDPNVAEDEAEAFLKLEGLGLVWPDGVSLHKVELIIKCLDSSEGDISVEYLAEIQKILDAAAVPSFSDLERDLVKAGMLDAKKSSSRKFFIVIPRAAFLKHCQIYLAHEDQIRENPPVGIVICVGKFFHPLRKWGEKLLIENGLLDEKIKVRELSDD